MNQSLLRRIMLNQSLCPPSSSVGCRFFTVYGPWGRPDMAAFKFADKIEGGLPIKVYNGGKMMRVGEQLDAALSRANPNPNLNLNPKGLHVRGRYRRWRHQDHGVAGRGWFAASVQPREQSAAGIDEVHQGDGGDAAQDCGSQGQSFYLTCDRAPPPRVRGRRHRNRLLSPSSLTMLSLSSLLSRTWERTGPK